MSYQIEEIEKATAECKPLRSRGGGIINADALANNPNCYKKTNIPYGLPPRLNPLSCTQVYGEGSVKAKMPLGITNTMTSVCENGYEKKIGRAGSCCVPLTKEKKPNNQAKSNNKMAWIIGGIAVAGIAYFMFIKK